jgi:hypothetical protein
MNFEQIQELFSNAIQDDMERGAAWLNQAASEKFAKEYPAISTAIAKVMAGTEDQELVHTMIELKKGEAALIISNTGANGMYLQPDELPPDQQVPSAVIRTLATILHPGNEDLLDALRTRFIINLKETHDAH